MEESEPRLNIQRLGAGADYPRVKVFLNDHEIGRFKIYDRTGVLPSIENSEVHARKGFIRSGKITVSKTDLPANYKVVFKIKRLRSSVSKTHPLNFIVNFYILSKVFFFFANLVYVPFQYLKGIFIPGSVLKIFREK